MRKILLSLVTIFLLGFAIYIAIYGLNLGSIEIIGNVYDNKNLLEEGE